MKIGVSNGEIIDKYSILQIKENRIKNEEKRIYIHQEKQELEGPIEQFRNESGHHFTLYYNVLVAINEKIWDLTDQIHSNMEATEYKQFANDIFEYNKKRFRVKNILNHITNAILFEQKSYTNMDGCVLYLESEDKVLDNITTIFSLFIEYDVVKIITTEQLKEQIQQIFRCPTIKFIEWDNIGKCDIIINVLNTHPNLDDNLFKLQPVIYKSGGALGDFIHQLSVINEIYYKTGRKGKLYIVKDDFFRMNIETTYRDTYPIVIDQPYIDSYEIYGGEDVDINLSDWREYSDIYNNGWNKIFNDAYIISNWYKKIGVREIGSIGSMIEWGKHPWLKKHPDNLRKNVIINTVDYRFCDDIDFQKVITKYGIENVKFIDIVVEKGNMIYIPPYWLYSIQFIETSTIISFKYRTYMNLLAILPHLFIQMLQLQNIKPVLNTFDSTIIQKNKKPKKHKKVK
jgi:hypothetical protein